MSNQYNVIELEPKDHGLTARLPVGITASELLDREFEPLRWIAGDLIPEGTTILAGAPKVGKSWLALQLAIAVSVGGTVFGDTPVTRQGVLYLALEDSERRIRQRLEILDALPSDRLRFITRWKQGEEALELLRDWLTEHEEVRLVVVDTLQLIRGTDGGREQNYASDYDFLARLRQTVERLNVSLVVVHHTRKADSADPLFTVSGTLGITGAVDTVCVLKKQRQKANAELFVMGRDIEDQELAIEFGHGGWRIIGSAEEYRQSTERQEILRVLRDAGEPMRTKDIAEELGKEVRAASRLLVKMCDNGFIKRPKFGVYTVG